MNPPSSWPVSAAEGAGAGNVANDPGVAAAAAVPGAVVRGVPGNAGNAVPGNAGNAMPGNAGNGGAGNADGPAIALARA